MNVCNTFLMRLDKIQPSQLFISSAKLSKIMETFDPAKPETLDPIPIKKLGGEVFFTDGHTRAFAAHLFGLSKIRVFWDEDELDWEAYKICVGWCRKEGISAIVDLKSRIVSSEDYKLLWLRRCQKMQEELKTTRSQRHVQ
ncbi:hypothetical protein KAX01_03680 [Candidatus Bathyarchaeota archaeon]|nr:hypothetical protein [Candidatus Bathyarchaeota archaeon]